MKTPSPYINVMEFLSAGIYVFVNTFNKIILCEQIANIPDLNIFMPEL